jgi:hypothetical protein
MLSSLIEIVFFGGQINPPTPSFIVREWEVKEEAAPSPPRSGCRTGGIVIRNVAPLSLLRCYLCFCHIRKEKVEVKKEPTLEGEYRRLRAVEDPEEDLGLVWALQDLQVDAEREAMRARSTSASSGRWRTLEISSTSRPARERTALALAVS